MFSFGSIALRLVPALAALGLASAAQATLVLAPLHAGQFAAGGGADASMHRVDAGWSGSRIVWKDPDPIGSYAWGTGLWGRDDWQRTIDAAGGHGDADAPTVLDSWHGLVSSINFGNSRYRECHDVRWGSATLLPLFGADSFSGADCGDAEAGDPAQHNWVTHFSGYIRVVDADEYNFSVLYDDGFFFRLIGAGGQTLELEKDFLNPRDRKGFDENLALSAGLYAFELGSWNRLGAGVVDLRWLQGGDTEWTPVPTQNLLRTSDVPEPALPALLALGALLLAVSRRRRRP